MGDDQKDNWFSWDFFKKKSTEVAETCKNDIVEFSNTVVNDAKEIVDISLNLSGFGVSEEEDLSENLKRLGSIIGHYIADESDDTQDDRIMEKVQTYIYEPSTYLAEMDEKMKEFSERINILDFVGDSSVILSKNKRLQEIYSSLVPSKVSFPDFWMKYYYTIERVTLVDERKKLLENSVEEDISWEIEPEESKTNKNAPLYGEVEALRSGSQPVSQRKNGDHSSEKEGETVEDNGEDDWGDWE